MVDVQNTVRLVARTEELRKSCNSDIAALINAYGWHPKEDLRIIALTRLMRLLIGLDVSFRYAANADQTSILENIRLPGEQDINIEQYLVCNEIFLKLGFTSTLFFVVEGVVKSYLQYIDAAAYKKKKSIKSKCECLMNEKLEWSNFRFDCRVFDFLRLIRNCLHSNGMHFPLGDADSNVTIEYRGVTYEFRDGQRLDFVTWDLLLDIANDMRTLLFQIANNRSINKLAGSIPDVYAA
jgi:hypothetical protein